MKKLLLYLVLMIASSLSVHGQASQDEIEEPLPKVFLIGEYEERYGELYEEYHDILLSVCNDNMNLAFDRWMDMIGEMEAYAQSIDFDINGVKVWLKLFWDQDGTIDHLSFFLKPDSRNVDYAELSAFFSSFMNHYKLPLQAQVKFTHNGSAQFPVGVLPPTTRR